MHAGPVRHEEAKTSVLIPRCGFTGSPNGVVYWPIDESGK